MTLTERCQGCLVGGAAGDALGYAVEFIPLSSILKQYGAEGITSYDLIQGKALISDDTQMTLFTAEGLLTSPSLDPVACRDSIAQAYRNWFRTQMEEFREDPAETSILMQVPELFARRAPGITCLNAIDSGCRGRVAAPPNNSKGCGAVMRVAPIGLYLSPEKMPEDYCDYLGAEASALTHGHDLGWLPGGALVHMIRRLTYHGDDMKSAAASAVDAMERLYPDAPHIGYFRELMEKAVALGESETPIRDAVKACGEGWVGEEALAVAVCCAVRYETDFEAAICASVNHSGDSDSTGAICGNLLGARLGIDAIPEKFKTDLELYDLLMQFGKLLAS